MQCQKITLSKMSLLKRVKCVTGSIGFVLLDNEYIIKVVTKARNRTGFVSKDSTFCLFSVGAYNPVGDKIKQDSKNAMHREYTCQSQDQAR